MPNSTKKQNASALVKLVSGVLLLLRLDASSRQAVASCPNARRGVIYRLLYFCGFHTQVLVPLLSELGPPQKELGEYWALLCVLAFAASFMVTDLLFSGRYCLRRGAKSCACLGLAVMGGALVLHGVYFLLPTIPSSSFWRPLNDPYWVVVFLQIVLGIGMSFVNVSDSTLFNHAVGPSLKSIRGAGVTHEGIGNALKYLGIAFGSALGFFLYQCGSKITPSSGSGSDDIGPWLKASPLLLTGILQIVCIAIVRKLPQAEKKQDKPMLPRESTAHLWRTATLMQAMLLLVAAEGVASFIIMISQKPISGLSQKLLHDWNGIKWTIAMAVTCIAIVGLNACASVGSMLAQRVAQSTAGRFRRLNVSLSLCAALAAALMLVSLSYATSLRGAVNDWCGAIDGWWWADRYASWFPTLVVFLFLLLVAAIANATRGFSQSIIRSVALYEASLGRASESILIAIANACGRIIYLIAVLLVVQGIFDSPSAAGKASDPGVSVPAQFSSAWKPVEFKFTHDSIIVGLSAIFTIMFVVSIVRIWPTLTGRVRTYERDIIDRRANIGTSKSWGIIVRDIDFPAGHDVEIEVSLRAVPRGKMQPSMSPNAECATGGAGIGRQRGVE
ncbi:MAG: hypothetical protein ACKVZJ_07390 [Phycisphaerales bacterium]